MKHSLTSVLFFALTGSALHLSAADKDIALLPMQIFRPMPQKYADDQRTFQGIPSMTVSPNGRLWAAWYTGGDHEGQGNIVLLVTSGDGGKTWTQPLLAIDSPGAQVRAFDPSMWTDPDGKVWLFWAQCKAVGRNKWDGRGGVWATVTSNPDAEGAEWSAPRRLCDGVMMCKPIADSKGRWLLPSSVWNLAPDHPARTLVPGAHVVASENKGETWASVGHSTIPRDGGATVDEHNIVEMKDGTFWLLHRTRSGIAESRSDDGGKTWTEAQPSSYPHTAARFFIRRLQSGNLLFVKHGGIIKKGGGGRSRLQAFLSDDDGKTWKGGLMLDERHDVSYPDGDQDKNGVIYVIYDWERFGNKEILLARFTEEDILAGKVLSPNGALRLLVNKATAVHPTRGNAVDKEQVEP